MFGCLAMGLLANLPIALAPGMGMNAYFTYSVVGFRGTGTVSYEAALTAILIEGAIFLLLALTGIRYAIIRLVPEPVHYATPAAIGFFLAHLGLQTAEGIGVVVSDAATAVTLGACPPENRTPMVAFTAECAANTEFCIDSGAYTCDVLGGVMTSARTWVGILGLMIMVIMLAYK
jgi:AGZA family xanthine/uracil permease-like MFS transporter